MKAYHVDWGQNVSMIWVKEVETRITRASICKWLKLGVSEPASAHSTQLCIKINIEWITKTR